MKRLYVCAECGTTEATTYAVTTIGDWESDSTTEICRECDDILSRVPDLATAWDAGVRQQWAARERVKFNPYRITSSGVPE